MPETPSSAGKFNDSLVTVYTLVAGAIGAGIGYMVGLPAYVLVGPALFISLLNVLPVRFAISDLVRDTAFLLIGIAFGSGVDAGALVAIARWPVAFAVLALVLVVTVAASSAILNRYFRFDARASVLAATPGHLSFVISLGSALNLDVARVATVQTVRLLSLTLVVPFVALAFGVEVTAGILPPGDPMPLAHFAGLVVAAVLVALVFLRLKVPAAILLAGMVASALAHISGVVCGVMSRELALVCFVTVGTLIGTRFNGITLAQLKGALFAGLLTTAVAVIFAALAAVLVGWLIGMQTTQVLVAFAPGGLETMVAMGVMLGADPGFVAACHVGRLLFLGVLVPYMLSRAGRQEAERQT